MEFTLVETRREHIPALVAVHIACWQKNFRGLISQPSLDRINPSDWVERRIFHFENSPRIRLVALGAAGEVLGFVEGGPARDPRFTGLPEVYALYVGVAGQGKGIGRALFREMRARFRSAGHRQLIVKTLYDNPHSRGFYEAQGCVAAPEDSHFEFDGASYREVIYLCEC